MLKSNKHLPWETIMAAQDNAFCRLLIRLSLAFFLLAGGISGVLGDTRTSLMVLVFGMLVAFTVAIYGVGLATLNDLGGASFAVVMPFVPMWILLFGMQYARQYEPQLGFIPVVLGVLLLVRAFVVKPA